MLAGLIAATYPGGRSIKDGIPISTIDHFFREGPEPGILLSIDIKPGSDPNCFNLDGHGVIPVAILGSAALDVTEIDTDSLLFDGLAVRLRGNRGPLCSVEDANGDPFADLVCHFEDDPRNWTGGTTTATLTGELLDADRTTIAGADSICIVP